MDTNSKTAKNPILIRWLALASAAGAAASSAISLWLHNSLWLNFSIISSFLTISFIAALWHRLNQHAKLAELSQQSTIVHIQEVNDLHTELEKHRSFEMELRQSKVAAESSALAKSEFLATMSHEIRTPLNGIIPMLELLASSKLEPDQLDILHTAQSSAQLMKHIVDDILDYSKLEANKLKLETTGINIREIIYSVVQMFNSQAEVKRISINVHLDPALRLAMRGDPVRLRQVLSNIISNAIKFTQKGSISISVRAKSETKQHHILRFEIKDTGIGISPENSSRLFKAFSQADASTTRIYGGTGLGLVICKRIIDLMSGQIGVNSQPGFGSTFWFEIPMLKAVGDSQEMASDLKYASVLMFTSDPLLSLKFEQAHQNRESKLQFASSIFDTQKILHDSVAVGDNSDFDLLIIDANSGRQGALQLQKSIINNPEFSRLRIAVLNSSDTNALDWIKVPRCRIFNRNVESTILFSEISRFLSATTLGPQNTLRAHNEPQVLIQAQDEPIDISLSHGIVLLVEDNPINLLVAQRLIMLSNFEFVSAENGEVALELLQERKFDLVLMDCQMPVMDGYQATQQWRAIEAQTNAVRTPIIAMTANAMAEDRQKCLDSGMDDYLSKPVDRKLLKQTLLKWQNEKQAVKTEETKTPASMVNVDMNIAEPTADSKPVVLDLGIVKDLQEFMGDDYQSLIRIYLEDSPKLLQQIQSALVIQDPVALVNPAHTLKSSSANLGAVGLSKIAAQFEKSAREGKMDIPNQEAKNLLEEFNKAREALTALMEK
jgi:signal transduction histidine kinase/CheY-like chemotaxis protein/HPt (histidine-containing phosphotransfer) domain-containing protein